MEKRTQEAVTLLKQMIETPSLSGNENETATLIFDWMQERGLNPQRYKNNVYALATNAPKGAKRILLNSHHDTVKPGNNWVESPYKCCIDGDKMVGLGSNDAGASVVSLLQAFLYLSRLPELPYQLVIAITAEEETSGPNGIEALLPQLPSIDFGIVGEPTEMKMAVAERGLMILDVCVEGKTGHAARDEGINAIYKAMEDIAWFKSYEYEKESGFLGPVKMTVTQIAAGSQHNVVPDECHLVVDIRLNDLYPHEEALKIIEENIHGKAVPRSMRLKPSFISPEHPVVLRAKDLGIETFGSATMSDQAFMRFDTIKMGPGVSQRSHTPNEFIYVQEIDKGISDYIRLLEEFVFC